MNYKINEKTQRQLRFGMYLFIALSVISLLMEKIILTIFCVIFLLFSQYTGTMELEITEKEIITYSGVLKKRNSVNISDIKSFYFTFAIKGVSKIVTRDNKKVVIEFGKFENFDKVITEVYNSLKDIKDIDIDKRIVEFVKVRNG